MSLSASAIFLFHFFHISKTFFFEDFFLSGETKKSCLGPDQVNGKGRANGSCHFWSKTSEHSAWCGQVPCKSPIMKWVKSPEKNSLKPNAASHNNASWYTGTDGFLKHLPSRGSLYKKGSTLQKIILILGAPPHFFYMYKIVNIYKISQLFNPFISSCTLWLFPCVGNFDDAAANMGCRYLKIKISFPFCIYQKWNCWTMRYFYF